jgi:pilus assembly protein CpaC
MSVNRNLVLVSLAAAVCSGAPAFAQNNQQLSGAPAQRLDLAPSDSASVTQDLTITVNRSYMIDFNVDIDDIIVANPGIANVTAQTRRRVAVMGVAPGEANIVFLDRTGRQIKVLEISVTDGVAGMDQLRNLIRRHVPSSKIEIENANGRLIISGVAPNLAAADRIMQLAKSFAKEENAVLNLMTVAAKDQVALKVRYVEMQRSVIKQLGINLSGNLGIGELSNRVFETALNPLTGAQALTGTILGGQGWENNASIGISNSFALQGTALGGLAANLGYQNLVNGRQQSSVGAAFAALERVGVVRTLAEPTLTAISGEAGQFLVGGEFPVPVAQDEGKISIEFKEFGVGLGFTPVVLSEGRISLQLSVEVSELSQQGGFQSASVAGTDPDTGELISGQSITIPALKKRSTQTTVELPSGGSLVIAGMIQEQTRQILDGVPGAKDIPVLGALFRSRDFQNDESELVVIVTPYLVDPTDPQNLRDPDRGYLTARDARTVFFGKLNEVYAVPGSSADKSRPPQGASGFIFD